MLVLDAALTGAKGVNLWASFRNPPQRSTRLYRALVDTGLASSVFGALLPTEQPFLYSVSCTATSRHAAGGAGGGRGRGAGRRAGPTASRPPSSNARDTSFAPGWCSRPTPSRTSRTRSATSTRLRDVDVYHGLEAALAAVTLEDVARVARQYLAPANRTVGWFEPLSDELPAPER